MHDRADIAAQTDEYGCCTSGFHMEKGTGTTGLRIQDIYYM